MRFAFRGLTTLLAFLAGFCLIAGGVGRMVPERLKLEWYATLREDVDVVFVGSSHVYRQFDPQVFDDTRGAATTGKRSLNLGDLGMGLTEEYYLLKRILDLQPSGLRWVVIEGMPFMSGMRGEAKNDFTLRRIEWHDAPITWMTVREVLRRDLPWGDKWALLRRHVQHWWRRSVQLARGGDAVEAFGEPALDFWSEREELGRFGNGYFPLEIETCDEETLKHHRNFKRRPTRLVAAARAMPTVEEDDGGPADAAQRATVQRMEALAAEAGVGIVWWIHPTLERAPGWRQLLAEGDIQVLIAYDDPEHFPEFYRPGLHFDLSHLNREGSERMTARFAQDFVAATTPSSDGPR